MHCPVCADHVDCTSCVQVSCLVYYCMLICVQVGCLVDYCMLICILSMHIVFICSTVLLIMSFYEFLFVIGNNGKEETIDKQVDLESRKRIVKATV